MKVKKFNIPIYDYRCILIEIENKEDSEPLRRYLKRLKVGDNIVSEIVDPLSDNAHDGGYELFNGDRKLGIILVYPCFSAKKRLEVLAHEKRHLEDDILNKCRIKDMETSAYLAGFLATKLFD